MSPCECIILRKEVFGKEIFLHTVTARGERFIRLKDIEKVFEAGQCHIAKNTKGEDFFVANRKEFTCQGVKCFFIGETAWLGSLKKTNMKIEVFISFVKNNLFIISNDLEEQESGISMIKITAPPNGSQPVKQAKGDQTSFFSSIFFFFFFFFTFVIFSFAFCV